MTQVEEDAWALVLLFPISLGQFCIQHGGSIDQSFGIRSSFDGVVLLVQHVNICEIWR